MRHLYAIFTQNPIFEAQMKSNAFILKIKPLVVLGRFWLISAHFSLDFHQTGPLGPYARHMHVLKT